MVKRRYSVLLMAGLAVSAAGAETAAVKPDLESEWKAEFDQINGFLHAPAGGGRRQTISRAWFGSISNQVYRQDSLLFPWDRDPVDVVLRRTRALMRSIGKMGPDLDLRDHESRLAQLEKRAAVVPLMPPPKPVLRQARTTSSGARGKPKRPKLDDLMTESIDEDRSDETSGLDGLIAALDADLARQRAKLKAQREAMQDVTPDDNDTLGNLLEAMDSRTRGKPAVKPVKQTAQDGKSMHPRYRLFVDICALRREIALMNPLLDFRGIVFVKRHRSRYNHMCDQFYGCYAVAGGGLYVLAHPFSSEPRLHDVLGNSIVENGRYRGRKLEPGAFLSPDLSYDGKTILFAYTEAKGGSGFDWPASNDTGGWNPTNTYHIFRVNVDGTGLRQVTDGCWNEFDPCWLPNGRVAFISERRGGQLRCGARPNPTYAMHTVSPDGTDIRRISHHETHEWQPSVNNDGMIVYTRWDYVDRDSDIAHHPWLTTPEGRNPRAIHGNYPGKGGRERRPWMEMDIRAIPNSTWYVTTAAPHHGQAYGSLVMLDPNVEDDDAMSQLSRLTPEVPFPEAELSRGFQYYGTAWPLSHEFFLCVYAHPQNPGNYGIYLLDAFGNRVLIYRDPAIGCRDPIPLRPRTRPPVMPKLGEPLRMDLARNAPADAGEAAKGEAVVVCVNVYDGFLPWPEDSRIHALRIIQLYPKANQPQNKPPVSVAASQSLVRGVLGTVPVEADGSCHFRVPAAKTVYFQALDKEGRAVQSMRSATYFHSGETQTCQGCHERRYSAPAMPRAIPIALRRKPSRIKPDVPGSHPVFYPQLVQPILDRHCVACHRKEEKAPDLAMEDGQCRSHRVLGKHAFAWSGGNGTVNKEGGRTTPGKFGARAARLYKMLAEGHHKVKLPKEDMHRIVLWLDCNSNFYSAYRDMNAQIAGNLVLPVLE